MERDWIIPACLFVAAQQAITRAVAHHLQFGGGAPFLPYGSIAIGCMGAVVAALIVFDASWSLRDNKPILHLKTCVVSRKRQFSILAIGYMLGWLQLVSLTWTKSLIPLVTDMWADPVLADIDAAIFGNDVWRILHPIFAPYMDAIDLLYSLWAMSIQLTLGVTLLARQGPRKSAALLAFFLTVGIIGVAGQFLLPSGGPIFWERLGHGPRFADYTAANHTAFAGNYLWAKYSGDTVGFASGISAFPSMHVAMAAWMVISIRSNFPKAQLGAWLYFVIVCLGSVALGWHYFVDGLAGAIGAIGCYLLANQIIKRPFSRPSTTLAHSN